MLEPLNTSERAILDALLDIDGATVQEVRQRFLPSDLVAVLSPSGGWRTRANFIKAVSSARPSRFRPAIDTRGGRSCRAGGGGSVSSCLSFQSEPVIGGREDPGGAGPGQPVGGECPGEASPGVGCGEISHRSA